MLIVSAAIPFVCLIILQNISLAQPATRCYLCSTTTKANCADMNDVSDLEICQTTTGSQINCIMYKYLLNTREIVYRGCRVQTDTCDDIKNALEKENRPYVDCGLCDTDLCKASAAPVKFSIALVPTLILTNYII